MGSLALVRQQALEEDNSEFKPVKISFKIDLVPHPSRSEGFVNLCTKFSVLISSSN